MSVRSRSLALYIRLQLHAFSTIPADISTVMGDTVNLADDRRHELLAAIIPLAILANVSVALRFVSRRIRGVDLRWDDYLVVVGLVRYYSVI